MFILFTMKVMTQTISIRDNSTADFIKNVLIKDKNGKLTSSNQLGQADLSNLNTGDSILMFHPDYFNWKGMIKGQNEIFMMSRSVNLN